MFFMFYIDFKQAEESMKENISNLNQDSEYSGHISNINFLKYK